jgi:hypothetical protein
MPRPGRIPIATLASLLLTFAADTARAYNSEEHKLLADWGASLVQLPPSITLPFPTRFQDSTLSFRRAVYVNAKNMAVGFATNDPNYFRDDKPDVQDNSYVTNYAQLAGNKLLYIPDDAHLRGRTLLVGSVTDRTQDAFTFGELVAIYGDYRRTVHCVTGDCYLTDANTGTLTFEQGQNCFGFSCGWRPSPRTMTNYLRFIGAGLWPPYGECGNATGNTADDVTYGEAGWWGDEMLRIAQSNDWHFSSAAVAWYVGMHRLALHYVDLARTQPYYWNHALHYEADALHSLTDLFAFGHVVTNRDRTSYAVMTGTTLTQKPAYLWMENVLRVGGGTRNSEGRILLDAALPVIVDRANERLDFLPSYTPTTWAFYARQEHDFHDAFNHSGATVRNLKGDRFTILGDGGLAQSGLETARIAADAVRASLQSLFDAYLRLQAGARVEDIARAGDAYFAALKSIPIFVESHPNYTYQRPFLCGLPGETNNPGHNFDGRWTRYAAFADGISGAHVVPGDAGSCLMAYEDGAQEIPERVSPSPCTTFPVIPTPVPPVLSLAQSRPNPSTASRTVVIEYSLATSSDVRLEVFDGRGAPVVTLEDGARDAGPHLVSWDGTNAKGHRVPAGVYYYRLVIPGHEQTKPIVWLR